MVDDPNRKTPRQFQCRDYLWDSFEQLSTELECSIDYLINESMRHYLRAQGRTGASKTGTSTAAIETPRPNGVMGSSANMPMQRQPTPAIAARPPVMPAMPAARPPSMSGAARPSMPQIPSAAPAIPPLGAGRPSPPVPQMPAMRGPSQSSLGSTPPVLGGGGMPSPPAMNRAPAPPPRASQAAVQPPAQRVLFATYGSEEVPVTKEEFFIGRGQKLCDLVIRDTNISRQHARVVLHNGQYWMIDNQSTNGVEFRGAKIQQKRIDEGDVFTIGGHHVSAQYP